MTPKAKIILLAAASAVVVTIYLFLDLGEVGIMLFRDGSPKYSPLY